MVPRSSDSLLFPIITARLRTESAARSCSNIRGCTNLVGHARVEGGQARLIAN